MSEHMAVSVAVQLPMTPNYIRLSAGGNIDIASLTEAELREIGKAWTDSLVAKAMARKVAPTSGGE